MINPFKLKKTAALLMMGLLPTIGWQFGLNYNILYALMFLAVFMILGFVIGTKLLYNPFSAMLEGAGLLALDLNSTGILRPFICKVNQPFVTGNIGPDKINDVYDMDAVVRLAPPANAGKVDIKNGKIKIVLDEHQFNNSRYGLFQYPVLIYNSQIKSLLTKDYLSEKEKKSFSEHTVLYLNRKLEEFTSITRDFARYVVELTKPTGNIFQNPIVRVIIIIVVIIMVAFLAKPLIANMAGAAGAAGTAITDMPTPVIPQG